MYAMLDKNLYVMLVKNVCNLRLCILVMLDGRKGSHNAQEKF